MKEYKRLTETLSHYINGKSCKPYGHCLANCTKQMSFVNPERKANGCGECQHFEKVLTRLAELEDKIENGTLIELPCKVGEIAYFIIDNERVELHEVVKISYKKNLCGKEKWHISYSEGLFGYNEFELGYRCFVTEVEAKAKLKEINDGK